jgi:hypothetical protein
VDSSAKSLIESGDKLFSKRSTLMSLWQETANNFYVERADFTVERIIGTTFAEQLMTSYPLVARRDLGNSIGSMLRPKEKEWFFTETTRQDRVDNAGKKWLEYATNVQRRAMYDRVTKFVRATKEGDHDFAAFGQTVISYELNRHGDALLYRTWHLRDTAWAEDETGDVATLHRKWKPYAKDVVRMFPGTVSEKTRALADKDPFAEVEVRHIVLPSEEYDGARENGKLKRWKFTSIYVDVGGAAVLEETGRRTLGYVVPRWQTVSGSQYAYSPATVAALPDARLIQAMTLTLLEAGERFTNPPMVAVQEAIRSDVQVFAGGITWVDAEYDERLGEVLRPLAQDKSGMPIGRELRNDVKEMLGECFFLNKLTMPPMGDNPEMTAFEVGQRVQEYIRQALPLFEPMEQEYNGGLCDGTFDVLLHAGAFGAIRDIPRSVLGADIRFRFESPLTEIIDSQKGAKLGNAKQLLALVADVDPSSQYVVDWSTAFRDALEGSRTPADWLNDPKKSAAMAQQQQQAQQEEQLLGGMERSAGIVKNLGGIGSVSQALGGPPTASPAPGAPAAAGG